MQNLGREFARKVSRKSEITPRVVMHHGNIAGVLGESLLSAIHLLKVGAMVYVNYEPLRRLLAVLRTANQYIYCKRRSWNLAHTSTLVPVSRWELAQTVQVGRVLQS
jgi:hypothetical protein